MAALPSLQVQWPLIIVESLLVIVGSVLMLAKRSSERTFPSWFRRLAGRKRLSVLLPGLLVLGVRLTLIPVLGIPEPQWHDEFSYLLAADTFAHGRLTNPTPPEWEHFETFHVILQPTYMSIYPPVQGIVLAVGQSLGEPWIGQLLITAAMCSAICWMLQGWLPPTWALLGGILAVLRLGILSYWMNGFWSASVVAMAGALLTGAVPRLKRRITISDTLWMALGIFLLANSRPFEGMILSVAVAVYLLLWIFGKNSPDFKTLLARFIIPIVIVSALTAAATAYYYHRVTGSALRMTYQVDQDTYASVPFFIFQTLKPEHTYRHQVLRAFYENDRRVFEDLRTVPGFVRQSVIRLGTWWNFYLGPLLTIPLLALPWIVRDRRARFPLITLALMAVALSLVTWFLPHYFAPATALLYLIVIQCLRHISFWSLRHGRPAVRFLILIACSMLCLRIAAIAAHAPLEPRWPRGNLARARLVSQLNQMPGQQVVIVRYGASHDPVDEWVYNSANLLQSKIIWARDMGTVANDELLRSLGSAQAWIVQADASPPSMGMYRPK